MKTHKFSTRVLAMLLTLVMVLGMVPTMAFAAAPDAGGQPKAFPFGPDNTMLEVGHYAIPMVVYRSYEHDRAEYNEYFRGATLDVNADGTAKLTLLLQEVENQLLGKVSLANLQYYNKYWIGNPETEAPDFLNNQYLQDFTVDEQDANGNSTKVSCTLPYTDKNGIYIQFNMIVDSQKFVELDFANAVLNGEPIAPNPLKKPGAISFEPNEPSFETSVDVTLSTVPKDSLIMYTLDGSTPTLTHGTEYTGPIHLTETAIIKGATFNRQDTGLTGGVTQYMYYLTADMEAGENVDNMLQRLHPVEELTLDREPEVIAARRAYDALTPGQLVYLSERGGWISNLEKAEARIAELKAEQNALSGYYEVHMNQDNKPQPSMCDPLFHPVAEVTENGENVNITIYVFKPVPSFLDQGVDGTVKNVSIIYNGVKYNAVSDITTLPVKAAKGTVALFGLVQGEGYSCQTLTFTLPKAALNEEKLDVAAYVNVVMMSDVDFDMVLTKMDGKYAKAGQKVQNQIADLPAEISLESETAIKAARAAYNGLDYNAQYFVNNLKTLKDAEAKLDELKNPPVAGTYAVVMNQDNKAAPSMCNPLFHALGDVTESGDNAVVTVYVFNPVPGFPDQGTDGTVKNVSITYNGVKYDVVSDMENKPAKMAKATNALFGLEEGKTYPCQTLTFTLPRAAILEPKLDVAAYVNVVMMNDVDFDMVLTRTTEDDTKAADAVEAKIADLGKVTIESETAITQAREAFTALNDTQQAMVANMETLIAAETKLQQLKDAEADKTAAEAVDTKIAAIGKVTLESETKITEARKAYDELTEAQKALVTKLDVLKAAEAELKELKDAAAQAEADKTAAEAVDTKIAAIGEVTLESAAKITEARKAYDELTDVQKTLVTELDVLEKAEQTLKYLQAPAMADGKYTANVIMMHEYKNQPSMCDSMFDAVANIEIKGENATMTLLVANPVPNFADQGADGTVKNVVINFGGQQYTAESVLNSGVKMTAKDDNALFGFAKNEQYNAQVLTFNLPSTAIREGIMLDTDCYVNVVMMTDVIFRINLTNIEEKHDVPAERNGTVDVTMNKDNKTEPSMSNVMFAQKGDVQRNDDGTVTLTLYVAYPVPKYPELGKDGTVKDMYITLDGQKYNAHSDITSKPLMTVKETKDAFNLVKGDRIPAQVLTFTLPEKALEAQYLDVHTYVNVVMDTEVDFDMYLENLTWGPVDPDPEIPDVNHPAVDTTDKNSGITVHADKNIFQETVKLVVDPIVRGETGFEAAEKLLKTTGEKFRIYEIHFENENGEEVQPKGNVTVSYPIPAKMNPKNVQMYRINEDGTKTKINGTVKEGMFIVSQKSFSTYALVEKNSHKQVFTDISGHWGEENIYFAVENGIFDGMTPTTFQPETNVTRGMFVTILGRIYGVDPNGSGKTQFKDVAENRYYAPYIAWAAANGITNGQGADDIFAPEKPITREEMAVFLHRYCKLTGVELEDHGAIQFKDAAKISGWAKESVDAMSSARLLQGMGPDTFSPRSLSKRAQAATLLSRFMRDYIF